MHAVKSPLSEQVKTVVAELSCQNSGLFDSLQAEKGLFVRELPWGKVVSAFAEATIDTLVFFVHSGTNLPTECEPFLNEKGVDQLAKTIIDNVDLGGGLVTSELSTYLKKSPGMAIVWYDFTRLVGDANRVNLDEQIPFVPYRGASIWKAGGDFTKVQALVAKQTVQPFYEDAEALFREYSPTLCIYFHSYDERAAGGSATKTVSDSFEATALRPAGMIFRENPQDAKNPFLSDTEVVELSKLLENKLKTIEYVLTTERTDVTIDEPYRAAASLLTYLKALKPSVRHLFFEVRKDIFKSAPAASVQAVTSFIISSREISHSID